MAEEPEIPLIPTEEPRYCPACGTRVAAKATTCLMCGAPLVEEGAPEENVQRGLPGWARALIVVVLALAILAAGGFGLYTLLTAEPEPVAPTLTPTRTPTATPSPTPTHTPTVTPTPTPIPPRVHQVQEGETLVVIAAAYDTTVEEILALNPDVEPELLQVGQLLLIPAATPMPGPTSTPEPGVPTPTPGDFIIHVVAPGETLISIAEEYEVSVPLIRAANDLPPGDDTIRVNQSLVIPVGTPVPSPTPTVDPNATPTPVPPYSAPPLLSPPDGAVFVGDDEPILLQWASVSILHDDEWYELTLSQLPSGVISATVHTRATAWRVPIELLLTTHADVREFRWQVQVVREARDKDGALVYEKAGAPSQVRTFIWLEPTPTPSLTPTSAP
ncbi:MAG TPA: LysM peptidoglycan-binding domain-containing protein [Thermoflexia bacterium]|nr:LysM peptidoglycan-binding domain-containing protein [Thermoflexia bacterium]